MDGNYWNLEYGTSLSRALFQYKHFVCLEAEDPGAYALILEDVGGRAVHWSGVWSPQSSVLWGWDGQRPLPKLADSACFFFRMFAQSGQVKDHNHLILQIFPVPESIV